ncbi:SET domain-containing protein-lysine N-methyltransferase [uncultured Legionella sp.]|uniref:SET domain-containing protein-lysine N-methyltransferase n=1 Tax=uncultured Legionella sp. TaxID=210934 RepID=UPI00260C7C99|nr:SET domain-containing protein-lysine N-methyltransferase [uncultured Legionella sp.]
MSTITLTNNNQNSQDLKVTINLKDGWCFFPDGREIDLKHFLLQSDFTHPLLSEPFMAHKDNVYHYEYNNVRELFGAAVFVYATLLHVDNPSLCIFKINPSGHFHYNKQVDDLYFSMNSDKTAEDTISLEQLNSIVGDMLRIQFKFSEDLIINDSFSFETLPSTVDGDKLFTAQQYLYDLLETPGDLSRFEIRYIDPLIGLGVYSRKVIKAGDIVGIYTGIKTNRNPPYMGFVFKPENDYLNMFLDARSHGNITRFINHAPEPDSENERHESSRGLIANVKSFIYYFNGISIIVFIAIQDIAPGQQLLINYGADYFQTYTPSRFKIRRRFGGFFNVFSTNRLKQIRIMAKHGVKKAQIYLNLRLIYIFIGICIIMSGLQFLSFN